MKRRNDVEKTGEPMFPRLHVNDKTKGGPRAPPRNKMALYEQLTIPSQMFNPRGLPRNTLPTSSIQGGDDAMDSLHLSSTDDHPDDKAHSRHEKQGDEDDCSVPIYVQSRARRDVKRGEKSTSACSKSSSNVAHDEREDGCRHHYSPGMDSKDDTMSAGEDKSKLPGDVSPDDVVGVMGQKRFWKARETIANHQRVFAFQLFELHRLMKVQQLISRSPDLCFEDRFFLANSTDNVSPKAKRPSKCIGKALSPIMNSEASKKLIDRKQCSFKFAENAQHSGAAHPEPLPSEGNMASWCFPQPISARWLIPVMSPSEGLIYKPCPEGYVPYGSMPVMGGFSNPCSIRPMNLTISDSVGDQSSSCGRGSNCQQSSVPTQKSSFVPSDASRGTELLARSRSHHSKRDQREGPDPLVDEAVTLSNMQAHGSNLPIQVIKVVPRNPQSAVESAARIFESIQEERKLQFRDGFYQVL